MHCANHRVGILYRENLAKKSYELRYFFIDDDANLFYVNSLARIHKAMRFSKDITQMKIKLMKLGERFLDLKKYQISAPKSYSTEAVIPFSNRLCFDIKQKQAKFDDKIFQIFGLMEQDTPLIHKEILYLTNKQNQNVTRNKRKSVLEVKKQRQQKDVQLVFLNFVQNKQDFSMKGTTQKDNQYEGENKEGVAEGIGKQIMISRGITYTGEFQKGQKHGSGYLVNENLATLQCEFIADELAGI